MCLLAVDKIVQLSDLLIYSYLRNSHITSLLQMFDLPLCHAHFLPHLTVLISAFPLFYDNSWLLLVR